MSFKELELDQIPFENSFLRDEEHGRKRIMMSMDRLDSSWDAVVKTTSAIMSVAVATVPADDLENAREVLTGMVGLFYLMTESVTAKLGGNHWQWFSVAARSG